MYIADTYKVDAKMKEQQLSELQSQLGATNIIHEELKRQHASLSQGYIKVKTELDKTNKKLTAVSVCQF